MWFAAEVAAKNGYIDVATRINKAVKEMSAETASEMGVDYTDIRDTVRPQVRTRLLAELIIRFQWCGGHELVAVALCCHLDAPPIICTTLFSTEM